MASHTSADDTRHGSTQSPLARGAAALAADLRYALRVLRKTPGFTAAAVLMLALGTGVNAAVFSVVDGVLLRSPFERPEEIASVAVEMPGRGVTSAVPRELYERVAAHSVLAAASIHTVSSPIARGIDVPRRTQVECVQATMIDVLGSRPLMGRWFSREEDRPGAPGVGVVSFRFWQADLQSDPNVLGRTIALDGEPMTIVGVMRTGFDGALSRRNRDIWVPLGLSTPARAAFGCRAPNDTVNAFVRLQSGRSPEDGTWILNAGPESSAGGSSEGRVFLASVAEQTVGDLRRPFLALVGAVVAVLLIACANVANLSLERMVGRRREIAVRLAMGASRRRIVRQAVTEQILVAAMGAGLGVLLARVSLDAIIALLPRFMPHVEVIGLDVRVAAAAIAVTLAAGFLVGLVPALQGSAVDLRSALSDGGRGGTRAGRGVRRVLIVGEIALGVMLLVGALLMIRTFITLRPSAPGFDPRDKTIALARLPTDLTLEARQRFFEDVSREVEALPGVQAVAGTTYIPMSRNVALLDVAVGESKGEVFTGTVSPNYFDVMAIPVTRGRAFSEADGAGAPRAAVVNEAFVRRWLPAAEPLGTAIRVNLNRQMVEARIVGVLRDARSFGSDTRARPELYLPFGQAILGSAYFVVSADPRVQASLPASLRSIVSRVRPGQLVDRIEAFEAMLGAEVATPRFGAWLLGVFAALAVILSGGGLAAILIWSVTARRREIGVRMALGAGHRHVRSLVLRQTLMLSGAGIALGLLGAAFATRLIEGWLYGVARLDAVTYAGCAVLMLAVSLAAAWLPARRATRVDPMLVLRAE